MTAFSIGNAGTAVRHRETRARIFMKDMTQQIANTLKATRARYGWSLSLTAVKTGVSKAMLGQIERGESSPTVALLWKIASGMNIPFSVFISSPELQEDVLHRTGIPAPISSSETAMRVTPLFPFDATLGFEVLVVEVVAGGFSASSPHERGVIEHVIVVSGELELDIDGVWHRLSSGDAIRFAADCPHAYRNSTAELVRFHNLIHYPELPAGDNPRELIQKNSI
jgi:transcriptional regulator with XRE-family HTH domain